MITLGHAIKETPVRFFDSVAHKGQGSLTRKPSFLADFMRDQQEQGQIRPGVTYREVDNPLDRVEIQPPPMALVSRGRIEKPIAQNDFPARQGRADDFANQLSPA